jgi:hypothetical protein
MAISRNWPGAHASRAGADDDLTGSPEPGTDKTEVQPQNRNQWSQSMNCPVCGANAEQIMSTTDGVSIVCAMCGEYAVSSSVLATEQLQRLEPEERGNALNKAKRSALPGTRPMITTNLIAANIELGEQSVAMSD